MTHHSDTVDVSRAWRAARTPVLIVVAVVMLAVITVLVRGDQAATALDPQSPAPSGTRALTTLLQDEGVTTHKAEVFADALQSGAGGTVVIAGPARIPAGNLTELASAAATVVLIQPPEHVLARFGVEVSHDVIARAATRQPDCESPAATAAGPVTLGGPVYVSDDPIESCYEGNLLVFEHDDTQIVVFGSSDPLVNDNVGDEGNAALSMWLLGQHDNLTWYFPSWNDPAFGDEGSTIIELVPAGWRFGAIQLVIAAILIAVWRARRLGPLVTEPLPVIVRGAETTEGRARLYQRSGDTNHAAATLRAAASRRIRHKLHLPSAADIDVIVTEAARLTGLRVDAIRTLLDGQPLTDDGALITLARELDDLECAIDDATTTRSNEINEH
ncbi:DUF4350 domain-containing protein [Hoyosella rhizosphaerae]|uniref:DUF4350 domain-containing protein n=1 Tax=Hoyosella rhizosphaerae TaxID=1755582 RepID=A0A916U2M2_9ACTN|nr:DUF4350 domain-containing protein [Hoyosella rhizosphaerae]MBN4926673.1 DUF4350 domain-containing protein [Hoyosella rhizosphaerae]GGC57361.1 hypothetical protein GCM10011410_07340 [Hoyosella rhizosphaerae]